MSQVTLTQPTPTLMDPWAIAASDFPADGSPNDKLMYLLRYAVLAPSGHNAQPWLFAIDGDAVELYADRTRALPVLDPLDRELTISCGAALLNLQLALRHFGYRKTTEIFPDTGAPDLLARVSLAANDDISPDDDMLFAAIPRRHTNRQRFANRPLPSELLAALIEEAGMEGVWLRIVEGTERRKAVTDLIEGGEVMLWEDRRFRREIAAWVHPHRRRHHDGIPGYAPGLADLTSLLAPDTASHVKLHDQQPTQPTTTPALAVLETAEDTPADWLATGQALERVLLRAQAAGVSASFLNQPIEVPELRPKLSEAMGRAGYPQLILRMGYGPEVRPTPRRPVEEVLFVPE